MAVSETDGAQHSMRNGQTFQKVMERLMSVTQRDNKYSIMKNKQKEREKRSEWVLRVFSHSAQKISTETASGASVVVFPQGMQL